MAARQSPEMVAADGIPAPALGLVDLLDREFTVRNLADVRHAVRDRAQRAGLTGDALDDFVVAVHELVANAVRHGGGRGRLRLRRQADTVVCDITDHGAGFADGIPVAAGPPATDIPGGRGILLARELTDTLLISNGPDGVTASLTVCLTAATTPAATTPAAERTIAANPDSASR